MRINTTPFIIIMREAGVMRSPTWLLRYRQGGSRLAGTSPYQAPRRPFSKQIIGHYRQTLIVKQEWWTLRQPLPAGPVAGAEERVVHTVDYRSDLFYYSCTVRHVNCKVLQWQARTCGYALLNSILSISNFINVLMCWEMQLKTCSSHNIPRTECTSPHSKTQMYHKHLSLPPFLTPKGDFPTQFTHMYHFNTLHRHDATPHQFSIFQILSNF